MICPPIVHMNGTSAESLLEQRLRLMSALHEAQAALAEACPNQRDFYPKPETWGPAIAEHEARALALRNMLNDVEAEAIVICDVIMEKGKR